MPEQQLQLRIVLLGKEDTLSQLNGLKQSVKDLSKVEVSSYQAAKTAIQQKNLALKEAQLQLKQAQIAEKEARANATKLSAEAKAQAIAEATATKQAASQKVVAIKQEIAAAQQALIEERQRTEQERQRAIAAKTSSQEIITGKKAETEAAKQAALEARTQSTQQQIQIRETREQQRQLNEQLKQERAYLNGLGAPIGSITRLRAETSQLRREAGLLNLTTAEGVAEFRRYQTTIDANARKIRDFDRSLSGSNTLVGEYSRGISGAVGQLKGLLLTYVSIQGLLQAGRFAFNTNIKLDSLNRSLKIISGSEQELTINQQFLNEQVEKFGLNIFSATQGFRNFYASATKAGLSANKTRQIFSQLAEVAANLRLNQDQENSVFLAFEQMISKGVVSTEELRRQLGNALPGAFELAAKSMNLTTQEFNKIIKSGKILSVDFLPDFANKLQETFGNGGKRVEGLQNSFNRLNNTLIGLATDPNSGIGQFFKELIDSLNVGLKLTDSLLFKMQEIAGLHPKTFNINYSDEFKKQIEDFKKFDEESQKDIIKVTQKTILETKNKIDALALGDIETTEKLIKIANETGNILSPEGETPKQTAQRYEDFKEAQARLVYLQKLLETQKQLNNGKIIKFPWEKKSSTGTTLPEIPQLTIPQNFKEFLDTYFQKFTDEEKKQVAKLKEQKLTPEDIFKQLFSNVQTIFSDTSGDESLTGFKAMQSLLEANGFSGDALNKILGEIFNFADPQKEFKKFISSISAGGEEKQDLASILNIKFSSTELDAINKYAAALSKAGFTAEEVGQKVANMKNEFKIIDVFATYANQLEPIISGINTAITNSQVGNIDLRISESQEKLRQLESDAERATGARKEELEADIKNQRDYQDKLEKDRDNARKKQIKREKEFALVQLAIKFAQDQAEIQGEIAVLLSNPITAAVAIEAAASLATLIASYAASVAAITSKKYALGGMVNGPSHANGGVNFINQLNGNMEQMEGGEYVTKKSATKNNLRTLETINRWGDKIRFNVMPQYAAGGLTAPLPLPRLPLPAGNQGAIDNHLDLMEAIKALSSRMDRLQVVNNAQDTVKTNDKQQTIKQVQNI